MPNQSVHALYLKPSSTEACVHYMHAMPLQSGLLARAKVHSRFFHCPRFPGHFDAEQLQFKRLWQLSYGMSNMHLPCAPPIHQTLAPLHCQTVHEHLQRKMERNSTAVGGPFLAAHHPQVLLPLFLSDLRLLSTAALHQIAVQCMPGAQLSSTSMTTTRHSESSAHPVTA